jgi:hypothetical protein
VSTCEHVFCFARVHLHPAWACWLRRRTAVPGGVLRDQPNEVLRKARSSIRTQDIRDLLLHLLSALPDLDAVLAAPLDERIRRVQAAGVRFSGATLQEVKSDANDGNFLHSGQVRLCCCLLKRHRCLCTAAGCCLHAVFNLVCPRCCICPVLLSSLHTKRKANVSAHALVIQMQANHYCVQSRLSIWEVVYSSLLHPDRRGGPEPPSGRTSAVHHRIALFNSQYQIVQIISQTDIMRYLHDHKDRIKASLDTKLMDVPGALLLVTCWQPCLAALCCAGFFKHKISKNTYPTDACVQPFQCCIPVRVRGCKSSSLM